MSNHLIVYTNRSDFKTLLELECKVAAGIQPVFKNSVEDFESMINLLPDLEVAVVDEPKNSNEFETLFRILSTRTKPWKSVFLITSQKNINAKFKTYTPEAIGEMINDLKSILNPVKSSAMKFITVPIETLIHFKIVPFDLYIKLGEDKFVKRIHANHDIDKDTVKELKAKGVQDLAFESNYNKDFSLMLLNNMINKVESDYKCEDDQITATNDVFLTTKDIVRSVGLPPKVIEVCESVMERITTDVVKGKDKFSTYLSSIKNKQDLNLQFRFVELTSFIATQMVELSSQGNNEEKIKTLVFCSFFCDVSLKDSTHLNYRSEESLKDLWPEDKDLISKHALKAHDLVVQYKNAPKEAAEIVKQHHGSLDGQGFPKIISENLHPLAICLFASQELAYALLTNSNVPSEKIVSDVAIRFKGTPVYPLLLMFEKSNHSKAA